MSLPPDCSVPESAVYQAETVAVLQELRERFPDAPFLTLGQTVLWDEPVKAALCRVMRDLEAGGAIRPGAKIVAGVHDTDYFAKLAGIVIRDAPFAILRHNDGDTRGLWSAAGEISALFGAEIVPSRGQLTHDGVGFARAAQAYPGGAETLLNQETDAPGWRAIVHTEPHPLLAADVKCGSIAPILLEQLRWAFRSSLKTLGCLEDLDVEQPCASRDVAKQILAWVEEFVTLEPEATLSDLYRSLIPQIWSLVGGEGGCNVTTTASMELFRFNGRTAALPRFRFVDLFLNPASRTQAIRAYNSAVRGSGIYTLDGFGPGALPFDVVIPGRGRGTLRILDGAISIETEEPIEICQNCDPESVEQLAAILEDRLGPDVVLVGKAVSLISMLSAEFIIVFHEKASGYTARTARMNRALRAVGIALPLKPILRLKHSALDALAGVSTQFKLPDYLARAFGTAEISADEFSAQWQGVAKAQDELRTASREARTPRALLELLSGAGDGVWPRKLAAYEAARAGLLAVRREVEPLEREIHELRKAARHQTVAARGLEMAKGNHFRETVAPLREEIARLHETVASRLTAVDLAGKPLKLSAAERAERVAQSAADMDRIEALRAEIRAMDGDRAQFEQKIRAHRTRSRELKGRAVQLVARKVELEKGAEAKQGRTILTTIGNEAELARLKLVRDAIWASDSLRYINYRPTAWWMPLVSPDGKWFSQVAASMIGRLEEL